MSRSLLAAAPAAALVVLGRAAVFRGKAGGISKGQRGVERWTVCLIGAIQDALEKDLFREEGEVFMPSVEGSKNLLKLVTYTYGIPAKWG